MFIKTVLAVGIVIFIYAGIFDMGISVGAESDDFKCLGASSKCYKVMLGQMTQQEAKEKCHGIGASLVSIHGSEENTFLLGMVKAAKSPLWIGLMLHRQSAGSQKIFGAAWTDGSPMSYGNPSSVKIGTVPWAANQPNAETFVPSETCTYFADDGWHDNGCGKSGPKGLLCQKAALKKA